MREGLRPHLAKYILKIKIFWWNKIKVLDLTLIVARTYCFQIIVTNTLQTKIQRLHDINLLFFDLTNKFLLMKKSENYESY